MNIALYPSQTTRYNVQTPSKPDKFSQNSLSKPLKSTHGSSTPIISHRLKNPRKSSIPTRTSSIDSIQQHHKQSSEAYMAQNKDAKTHTHPFLPLPDASTTCPQMDTQTGVVITLAFGMYELHDYYGWPNIKTTCSASSLSSSSSSFSSSSTSVSSSNIPSVSHPTAPSSASHTKNNHHLKKATSALSVRYFGELVHRQSWSIVPPSPHAHTVSSSSPPNNAPKSTTCTLTQSSNTVSRTDSHAAMTSSNSSTDRPLRSTVLSPSTTNKRRPRGLSNVSISSTSSSSSSESGVDNQQTSTTKTHPCKSSVSDPCTSSASTNAATKRKQPPCNAASIDCATSTNASLSGENQEEKLRRSKRSRKTK